MFLILCIVSILLLYICSLFKTYSYWKRKGIVGPVPWPIVGNYGSVICRVETEAEYLRKIYEKYPDEKFVGLYKGVHRVLFVRDPNIIKQVLIKDFANFHVRCIDQPLTMYDKSLFIMPGDEKWYSLRKSMSPTFTKARLRKMTPLIDKCIDKYLENIENLPESQEVDIRLLHNQFLVDVVATVFFGVDFGVSSEKNNFETAIIKILDLHVDASVFHILALITPTILSILTPMIQYIFSNTFNVFHKYATSLIYKDKSEKLNNSMLSFLIETKEKSHPTTGKPSILPIDDNVIIQQIMSYSAASYLLISSLLSFIIYELAQHEDIQNKCYDEINEVFESYGDDLALDSINDMKYFDMVFDETIRKYGLNHVIDRKCVSKYTFPGTNLTVDEEVFIFVSPYGLHHDSKYFREPHVFDPKRFTPENKEKIPQCVFMPFGEGPRYCIGMRLAKLIILRSISRFLRKFKVLTSKPAEDKVKYNPRKRFTVSVLHELRVNIKRRF